MNCLALVMHSSRALVICLDSHSLACATSLGARSTGAGGGLRGGQEAGRHVDRADALPPHPRQVSNPIKTFIMRPSALRSNPFGDWRLVQWIIVINNNNNNNNILFSSVLLLLLLFLFLFIYLFIYFFNFIIIIIIIFLMMMRRYLSMIIIIIIIIIIIFIFIFIYLFIYLFF